MRERAKSYDWEALAERVLEIYRDATSGRSRHSRPHPAVETSR